MRVAIVSRRVGKTPEDITGSFIFDEAYRLTRNGVEVHIVRPKIERESISYGIHFHGIEKKINFEAIISFLRNITVYPLPSSLRKPKSLYRENLYAINVSRVVKANYIDLIHAHFAYPEGIIGLFAKKRLKKPLVVTCHGYDINVVPEIDYGIRLTKSHDSLVHRVLKNADAVICPSTNLRKEVLKFGVDTQKTFVVFNAVDLYLFSPPKRYELDEIINLRKQFGVDENDLLILNARHLTPVYGIEYLIYAAKIVTDHVKNAKFIIAGEGDLREKVNAMIHDMKLDKNVKLIGTVPRALMPKLMRASSLYVNTSLADGMSPSMLEACACGLPIVSFDVGGASDIIDNGINGFLVPPKDYRTLASRIIYLSNMDIMKNMGIKAREKAERKFSIDERIRKVIDIYNKVLVKQ